MNISLSVFSFLIHPFLFIFTETHKIVPRHLVYPPGFGNKVQFIVGIGFPASDLPQLESVSWGYVIKTNYVLPTNVSEYGTKILEKRSGPAIMRWDFYNSLGRVFNRWGFPGSDCIMKSICEAARIEFSSDNIIGEILHLFFTPSITSDVDNVYHEAEIFGKRNGSCNAYYCPFSLLELFSTVAGESRISIPIFPM